MDIKEILDTYGIPYRTRGSNVSSGNISVKCPWCEDDPSMHLAISLKDGAFYCWRNPEHKGRNTRRLLSRLLGISYEEAGDLVSKDYTKLGHNGRKKEKRQIDSGLSMPEYFRKFKGTDEEVYYRVYLAKRGFPDPVELSEKFDVRYCRWGIWRNSIVFPVRIFGDLKTWQVRYLYGKLRYRSLSSSYEMDGFKSVEPIKNCLGFFDFAKSNGGNILYVTEGVFDAMKINIYHDHLNCSSVCIFGCSNISHAQSNLLASLRTVYKRIVLLLDPDKYLLSLKFARELQWLRLETKKLDFKDPGDMNKGELENLVKDT